MPDTQMEQLEKILKQAEFHPKQGGQPAVAETPPTNPNVEKRLEELSKQLGNNQSAQQNNQLLQGMLSDPGIAAILQAKREGRQVKVVDAAELESARTTATEIPDLSSLGEDSQRLLKHLEKVVESNIEKQFKLTVEPVKQQVGQMSAMIQQEQGRRLTDRVEEVRKKHADFDNHLDAMRSLFVETGQKLDPEELYLIAKTRAGQTSEKPDTGTMSERPVDSATGASQRAIPPEPGPRGMQRIIEEAYSRRSSKPVG